MHKTGTQGCRMQHKAFLSEMPNEITPAEETCFKTAWIGELFWGQVCWTHAERRFKVRSNTVTNSEHTGNSANNRECCVCSAELCFVRDACRNDEKMLALDLVPWPFKTLRLRSRSTVAHLCLTIENSMHPKGPKVRKTMAQDL